MDSLATGLRCIDCGGAEPLGYTLQCPKCDGLVELLYDGSALQCSLNHRAYRILGAES